MNHLKNVFLGLAVVVTLVLAGANSAKADCTPSASKPVTAAKSVHAEGTTELLATMTITCTTASMIAGATSNLSLVFSPSTTKVTIGAGSTVAATGGGAAITSTCSTGAADNRSAFPCPSIAAVANVAADPALATPTVVATTSGNILNFNFTACTGAGGDPAGCLVGGAGSGITSLVFVVNGIRISVASTSLPAGGAITASEVTTGGIGSVSNGSVVFGIVQQTLGAGSGVSNATTLALAACGPAVVTPLGTPATLSGNPDLTAGTTTPKSTLAVALNEGFLQAFTTAATLDNGFASQASPTALQPNSGAATGTGLRFRINLTGIPSGFVVYTPEQVAVGSAAATGKVTGGGATAVITLVSGSAGDASGGTVVAAVANQYDLVTPSSGTAAITYEVTTASDPTGLESVVVNVTLTGTATTGVGSISAQVSLGPVGPPTVNAALPQFAPINKPAVVATVSLCASYLLFPWVVNTNDGNYDTGFAIANTTSDPSVIGTTGQSGDVTMYIFPSDGSAAITQSIATGLKPGATATFILSSLKKAISGYAIVVCNFTLGHGFAFIDNPIAGQNGFAEGYLALSVTNPRIGGILTESAGH